MNSFGKRLRILRKKRNLSQISLSIKLGMCQEAISSYERGATYPSIEVLCKFQEFFNVSFDYLLGLSNKENSISYDDLDSFEVYLISNYRKLPLYEQNLLLKISDTICDNNDFKKNTE